MNKLSLAVTFAVATLTPLAAHADQPGKHPAYLHAIEDLRYARALLERPARITVKWDEKVAIKEIDAALREIKEAAIDDGKPLTEHPAIDAKIEWGGRLRKAQELVAKAHADVDQEEDNNYARGLKHRALVHIDAANEMVKAGISDADAGGPPPPPPPEQHPAYLHAIEDLRFARALLARPAKAAVKWDEKVAIKEVDAALKEIKDAAIDDGKNLDDHPAVDAQLDYGGRLQKADELIQRARGDVDQKEDNNFARGLKRRAIKHLDLAHGFVQQGIANAAEPAKHPAYLHALQDLRLARALLARPSHNVEVKWDEKAAMREIEVGMKEIRDAAIDDGKDLDDHPPVDTDVEWGGRMQKALDLVDSAMKDVNEKEDNSYSHGLRNRAIGHLAKAIKLIRQGMDAAHPHVIDRR